MIELLQGKLTYIEFGIGVALAVMGGGIKAAIENYSVKTIVLNSVTGFFVSAISGLVLVEYWESKGMIVAMMGLSGYTGAGFLESVNILGKTIDSIRQALKKNL